MIATSLMSMLRIINLSKNLLTLVDMAEKDELVDESAIKDIFG